MKCSTESVHDFKAEATRHFPSLKIVTRFDTATDYDKARTIANSRLDLYPCVIAYCSTAKQVAFCIEYCSKRKWALRVRSGGHQHEGMSSGNDVFIIDLSEMNTIEYQSGNRAWLPSGKHLADVYNELEAKNFMIPGGACDSVFVGGLVQGGGWGLSSRRYGLTCDSIVQAEIVLANGDIVFADATNEHADLFWAIRGGGGGNFGVATRFLFTLHPLDGYMFDFFVSWGREHIKDITQKWLDVSPRFSNDLTTFCRIKAVKEEADNDRPALIGGRFYSNSQDKQKGLDELLLQLKPFYDIAVPKNKQFTPRLFTQPNSPGTVGEEQNTDSIDRVDLSALFMPAVPSKNELQAAPTSTCSGPNPHKVSSAFPNTGDAGQVASIVTNYINDTLDLGVDLKEVNLYISLMHLGGAVAHTRPDQSAFYYRQKEYILQYQAWWSDKNDANTDTYIRWIEGFRKAFSETSLTEGSFINFPDKSLEHRDRQQLLAYYYGLNLKRLEDIKYTYDRHNLFDFEMGILPVKAHH